MGRSEESDNLPKEDVANIGTGVLMGYKVFHFCDLTDPPKGFIRGVIGYLIKTLICSFSSI